MNQAKSSGRETTNNTGRDEADLCEDTAQPGWRGESVDNIPTDVVDSLTKAGIFQKLVESLSCYSGSWQYSFREVQVGIEHYVVGFSGQEFLACRDHLLAGHRQRFRR